MEAVFSKADKDEVLAKAGGVLFSALLDGRLDAALSEVRAERTLQSPQEDAHILGFGRDGQTRESQNQINMCF